MNLDSISVGDRNVSMGDIGFLIRPTRTCERLVFKIRQKGHKGGFYFLETIGLPFNGDLAG